MAWVSVHFYLTKWTEAPALPLLASFGLYMVLSVIVCYFLFLFALAVICYLDATIFNLIRRHFPKGKIKKLKGRLSFQFQKEKRFVQKLLKEEELIGIIIGVNATLVALLSVLFIFSPETTNQTRFVQVAGTQLALSLMFSVLAAWASVRFRKSSRKEK